MTVHTPKLAASVLLIRDSHEGPQIYFVKRHQGNKFMANAHVFAGGKVDALDKDEELLPHLIGHKPTEAWQSDLGQDTYRGLMVAAIRETFEEAGVLIADNQNGAALQTSELTPHRQALNTDRLTFPQFLKETNYRLPFDRLIYFAHWITPEIEPRRFDARFFLCQVTDAQEASHDEKETSWGGWMGIQHILKEHSDRNVHLAPPTYTMLNELSTFSSADDILQYGKDQTVRTVLPKGITVDGNLQLLSPDDARYENEEDQNGPRSYFSLDNGFWRHFES